MSHAAGQGSEPERPAAEPAQQEPPSSSGAGEQQQQYGSSSSVYIGSLQWWTSDAEIEALCAPHGAVQKIRFFEEKPSGKSKGYCLVTFDSPKGAYLCRQSLDGCVLPAFLCTGCTHAVIAVLGQPATSRRHAMADSKRTALPMGNTPGIVHLCRQISKVCTCHSRPPALWHP